MRIFIVEPNREKTALNVNENDTILKVKQMYGQMTGGKNIDGLICKGKVLEDYDIISHFVKEDAKLVIMTRLVAGGGINTVDISKNITNECEPALNGPSYREGCNGLCIQSICKNKNCVAYNDTIYVKIGYVQNWNLSEHLENQVLCPSCRKLVKPKNYYFMKCHYKIDYIKEIDDEYDSGTIEGNASDKKFKYFNEKESGNANFVKLIFTVREL